MHHKITVLHDTASGGVRRSLEEECFDTKREIFCHGEITAELANQLILQMRYLTKLDETAPITMYINSGGGSVSAGLAIYDAMNILSCPIHTVCTCLAASMASVLFTAGNHRLLYPHAEVMIHDPLISGMEKGSALAVEKISKRLMDKRIAIADILAKHSHHTRREVLKRMKSETYFTAKEAVAFGLADGIKEAGKGGSLCGMIQPQES